MADDRTPSPEFDPFAIGVDLAPLPEYKAAATAGFDFDGFLDQPLRLHEDLTSGCGGQTWPAGMVLAKHMLRYHQTDLRDSRMYVWGGFFLLFSEDNDALSTVPTEPIFLADY